MSEIDTSVEMQGMDAVRYNKLRGKAIKEVGIFWPYILIPIHLITLKPLLFYLKTVIFEFFLLQFKVKWGWRKATIARVTDVIDGDIPCISTEVSISLIF